MLPIPLTSRTLGFSFVTFFVLVFLIRQFRNAQTPGPEPISGSGYRRTIVAIGDLHADYDNMMKVLQMAKVVSENGSWSGHADYLVQTGDIVDRGDDTIKMYRYLENLRMEARAHGDDIRSHLGNHEVMNLIGDWRYVPTSEIKTFGGVEARQQLLAKGWVGRAWRANYTITSRIPLHNSLGPPNTDYDPHKDSEFQDLSHAALSFLHGGLSPSYKDLTPYPSRINDIGATLVRRLQDRKKQPPVHPPNSYPGLPEGTSHQEEELYGADGPLWYRGRRHSTWKFESSHTGIFTGWAMDKDTVVCAKIDAMLAKTGVKRFVMGHTPNFTGIVSRCGGKIVVIDTGISKAYGGVLSAARFEYSLSPSKSKGTWIEHDVVTAIYAKGDEVLIDEKREITADFL